MLREIWRDLGFEHDRAAASFMGPGSRLDDGHPLHVTVHGQWVRTSVWLTSMPCRPPELRITQGNCDVTEMNVLPLGRMVLIRETELPCIETATCLINLSLQNVPTLSPSMESKGKTKEGSSKELYPKINPFWTLLREEPQEGMDSPI